MATEDFQTTCGSHNINGFAGGYSGGEIFDNTTGILGNNDGGDQLAPERADLNPHQLGCEAAGGYWGTGPNPLAACSALPIPEFTTGGNLTGDGIYNYNPWASFDVSLIQPAVDFGQLLLTPEINPLPASINTPRHGVAANSPNGKPTCHCGKTFSRTDGRARHIRTATRRQPPVVSPVTIQVDIPGSVAPVGLFPCMLCDRHRGAGSFVRRDNLRQHLGEKGYHKMNKESIDDYFRRYH